MNGRRRRSTVWGLIFVALGVLFLLDQLDVIDLRAAYVLPTVLIVIGVAVLVAGMGARDRA